MFDIGFWELFILFVIALVVLGPERLPVAARTVGRWAGQARGFVRNMSNELEREVKSNEMAEALQQARNSVEKATSDVRKTTDAIKKGARDEISSFKPAPKPDPVNGDPDKDMMPLDADANTDVSHGQTTPKTGASAADQKNEP